jgi:hypothetical protein
VSGGQIFAPERFIDRVAEQELFRGLLSHEADARLLTIRDESGRGKSHLLKALRYHCQYATPPIPAALVALNELGEKTPHAVVRALHATLSRSAVRFPRLDALDEVLDAQLLGVPTGPTTGTLSGDRMTVGPGGVAGGMVFTGPVTFGGGARLDAERVRERTVKAFVEDLAETSATQTTVLLFDAYEHCGEDLEQWLPSFLRQAAFDPGTRMERLVVVLAGQQVPTAEFRVLLGPTFDAVVESIESLSLWDHEHVKAFLDINDVRGYRDSDVEWIVAKLREGWPLGRAVGAVRQWLREAHSS